MHLLAWTLHQPRAPRVDQLALELFARRSNGHWSTTQGNAWSLLALASYLRNVETGGRESAGNIAWGPTTKPFALSQATPLARNVFPLEPDDRRARRSRSPKPADRSFPKRSRLPRARLVEQPRQDQGYSIARRYAKIGDDGKLAPADNLRVGDRVLVTPRHRGADAARLMSPWRIRCRACWRRSIPPSNRRKSLAGESLGDEWVSDYHELREDRAVFFVDLLNPGRYTLRYLARVVCAGDAIAPAAKIEEMYHPEHFGTTETLRVSAQPLE